VCLNLVPHTVLAATNCFAFPYAEKLITKLRYETSTVCYYCTTTTTAIVLLLAYNYYNSLLLAATFQGSDGSAHNLLNDL
jgi:hypothetical protein